MLSRPQNSITTRSRPTPAPPCGGAPYLLAVCGREEAGGVSNVRVARARKLRKIADPPCSQLHQTPHRSSTPCPVRPGPAPSTPGAAPHPPPPAPLLT